MFKILVIDDDKNTRFFLKEILELQRFNVLTAEDGLKGFDVLENEKVDLVIVDIMMPNMDGYSFTREIRRLNSDLPILMISAKQLAEDRKKGFIVGIDDYMSKPLDSEELLLHVNALLRRAKINSSRKITIGDVVLDYDAYTVTKGEEVVELPKKEFMLLYKLLSYPDKIFTRIQIMDEIWGMDCDTGSETVTVHINRLRKKFEDWDVFEIKAIKGLGYKAVKKK